MTTGPDLNRVSDWEAAAWCAAGSCQPGVSRASRCSIGSATGWCLSLFFVIVVTSVLYRLRPWLNPRADCLKADEDQHRVPPLVLHCDAKPAPASRRTRIASAQ
jgi:hypothetical protein